MKKMLLAAAFGMAFAAVSSANVAGAVGTRADGERSQSKKCLVVYFSCTNTTQRAAAQIAAVTGGDLFRITPEKAYTEADLDYSDSSSRSTLEQKDADARPALSTKVKNWKDYDVVFIGYPIWWGIAPRAVYTFVESYDFAGKTVVPFYTSGGSGVGSSVSQLQKISKGKAVWKKGKRLQGNSSRKTVADWISEEFPAGL